MLSFFKLKNSFLEFFKLTFSFCIGFYLVILLIFFLTSLVPPSTEETYTQFPSNVSFSFIKDGKLVQEQVAVTVFINDQTGAVSKITLKEDEE